MQFTINHLNILVSDIQKSLIFYQNLGFNYIKNLGPKKIILEYSGFDFFIEEVDQVNPHPNSHFGIKTTSEGVYAFEKLLKRLAIPLVKGNNPEANVYEMPNSERVALYFADPDENVVEVYSDI